MRIGWRMKRIGLGRLGFLIAKNMCPKFFNRFWAFLCIRFKGTGGVLFVG